MPKVYICDRCGEIVRDAKDFFRHVTSMRSKHAKHVLVRHCHQELCRGCAIAVMDEVIAEDA